MRCAVIISGQPRSVLETYQNIQDTIIKPNNADVFLHSWIDKEMFGKSYKANWLVKQGQHGIAGNTVPSNIEQIILDEYKPKKYLFEPQKQFSYHPIIEKSKAPYLPIQDSFSMLYSIRRASEMKQEYEKENNLIYDVVMRIRFGMKFLKPSPIDLSKYLTSGVMFVPAGFGGFSSNAFLNNVSFCDHWSISNSHLTNKLSETFFNIENLVIKHNCFIQNEDLMGYWMRIINNIDIALLDFQYRINCR